MSGTLHLFYESSGESTALAVPPAVTITSIKPKVQSLLVTYTPCPAPFPGQPDIWYVATAVGTVDGIIHTATGTGSSLTIGGLSNGSTYTVTVLAYNFVGSSAACGYAAGVHSTARVYDVPTAPTIQLVTQSSATSLSISFTPPTYNGGSPVTSYQVYATDISGNTITWMYGNGNHYIPVFGTSPANLGGLLQGTVYSLAVAAVNAAGAGPKSDVVTQSTPRVPSVSSVSATPSIGSLALSIAADGYGVAITNFYVDIYRQGGTTPYKSVTSTASSLSINALPPGELVTVNVRATSQWGTSTISSQQVQLSGVVGSIYAPSIASVVSLSRNGKVTVNASQENPDAWAAAKLHGSIVYLITTDNGYTHSIPVDTTTGIGTGYVYPTGGNGNGDLTGYGTVPNPANGTTVTITVQVQSALYGLSAPSDPVSFTMGRRPSTVWNIRTAQTGTTSLYTEWDTPESDGGYPILDYLVTLWQALPTYGSSYVQAAGAAHTQMFYKVAGADQITGGNSTNFSGLQIGTGYLVLVQARNIKGYSFVAFTDAQEYDDTMANTLDNAYHGNVDISVPSLTQWPFFINSMGTINGMASIGVTTDNGYQVYIHPISGRNKYYNVICTAQVPVAPYLRNTAVTLADNNQQIIFSINLPGNPSLTEFVRDNLNSSVYPNLKLSAFYDAPSLYSLEDSQGNIYWQGAITSNTQNITVPLGNGKYSLKIRALNSAGWSPYSNVVLFNPCGLPNAPTITGVFNEIYPNNSNAASGQLYVAYSSDPSATGDGNGYAINSYGVVVYNSTLTQYLYPTVTGFKVTLAVQQFLAAKYGYSGNVGDTLYRCEGLPLGQTVNIAMTAHTNAGNSVKSNIVSGMAGYVTSAPYYQSVVLSDLLQVRVSWRAPSATYGYPVDHYEVVLVGAGTTSYLDSRNPTFTTTGDTSVIIGGLTAGGTYTAYIRAINDLGASAWATTALILMQNVPALYASVTPLTGSYAAGTTDGVSLVSLYIGYTLGSGAGTANGTPVDWIQIFNLNTNNCMHTGSGTPSQDLVWEGMPSANRTTLVIGGMQNGIAPVLAIRAHNAIGWSNIGAQASMFVPYGVPNVAPANFVVTDYVTSACVVRFDYTVLPATAQYNNGSAIAGYRIYTTHGEVMTFPGSGNGWNGWKGGYAAMHGQTVGFYVCAYNAAGEGPRAYTECYLP